MSGYVENSCHGLNGHYTQSPYIPFKMYFNFAHFFRCILIAFFFPLINSFTDHRDVDENAPINQPLMPTVRQPTCALWLGSFVAGLLCILLSIVAIITLSMFYVKDCAGGGVSDLPLEVGGGAMGRGGDNNLTANLCLILL